MSKKLEKVYLELSWYDGPREGVANLNGVPHRFTSQFDEQKDEWMGTFLLWPISGEEFAAEVEQWCIFVDWNNLFESGLVDTSTHPANKGINSRWDELELILSGKRKSIPSNALSAKAMFIRIEQESRYEKSGPNYDLCWQLL